MKKQTLSVVLATHNEERMLAQCLDSIKAIATEIIIADGESTDATLEIAKQYKAQIINTTNKPNFHINKQLAMDAARGDYVLQLDADEVVDDELRKFISLLLAKQDSEADGPVAWWLNRKNLFLGTWLKKGGQYPDPVIRLYKNGHARLPQKSVHEQMEADGEVAVAEGHLLHYSNPTFADYVRKFNTYTSFTALQMQESKQPLGVLPALRYCVFKPIMTCISLYLHHRGYVDGVAGLVFATMSGVHHTVAYLKYWELQQDE